MRTPFLATLLFAASVMAGGPSEPLAAAKTTEYNKVALGKYRIGETLEQCQARYEDKGRDLSEPGWKEFKKGDFYISVHFTKDHVDEIQYKHRDDGHVIPLEEPERRVLLSYNGDHWSQGEAWENVIVFFADRYSLVAQYGLETTTELEAGVMTIFTRDREAQRREEEKARLKAAQSAEEEAAKQRLKGL